MNRLEHLAKMCTNLRPGQRSLAQWEGGTMAVSAVPGAGKSHSLAVAAALTIARYNLHARKQLVIVTYTRSAASGIKTKIREHLKTLQLPQGGFVVHTLHGLALQIAIRHPELSGLNLDSATIITPNNNHRVVRTCVEQWIAANPYQYKTLLEAGNFDGEETERSRRQMVLRTEVLPSLTQTAVREAKSSGLSPEELWEYGQQAQEEYGILTIAAGLYQQYNRLMKAQNYIDYDDMVLGALNLLRKHQGILEFWQNQVFAVFEDEAQDSSPLQEQMLKLLASQSQNPHISPNLVRVGDPNQAINSTFTTADPFYFNQFCKENASRGTSATMNQAGRSTKVIIETANYTLHWVNQNLGTNNIQAPFRDQDIVTVSENDPQSDANPPQEGKGVEICTPTDIYETVKLIGERVIELLKKEPTRNAAILVRENRQGSFLAEQLQYLPRQHGIKIYEVAQSERSSLIPQEVLKLLQFLYRCHSPDYLKGALEVLQQRNLIPTQDLNALVTYPEQFLYPTPLTPPLKEQQEMARKYCCELLAAQLQLSPYQLIPFLGMTLNYSGSELATLEKLAQRIYQQTRGTTSIKNSIEILIEIISSEKFEPVEVQEDNDNQYTQPGVLTIITMHKAKGLDWDYVFMPFLHQDPFEPWVPNAVYFLGKFNMADVARGQIRHIVYSKYQDQTVTIPKQQQAWQQAVALKQAEEYRLLYVAMTRAKRLLWMCAEKEGPFRWSTFNSNSHRPLKTKKACDLIKHLLAVQISI